jgi:hypothetical protein
MPPSEATEHREIGRRRFALVGLAAVAVCAGLFFFVATPHINRIRVQRSIIASIEAAGGSAYFDYQTSGGTIKPHALPPGPFFVRALCGDDAFATVTVVAFWTPSVADAYVQSLHELPELKDVCLNGPRINDGCIDALLRIRLLRGLNLGDTAISPQGISKLAASTSLQNLTFYGRWVTNPHLEELANFPNLSHLQVIRTSITDRGVVGLGQIPSLRRLEIYSDAPVSDAGVTDAGVVGLKRLADLESLEIMSWGLTDASLAVIGELPRLRHVRLWGQFSDEGVRQLKAKLPGCYIDCRSSEADDSEKAGAFSGSGEPSVGADSR